jgi:beta-glucosidase
MDVPFRQNELIQAVAKVKPTIVVLHSGSPLDVSPWFDSVQAIVQSWFLGQGTPYWM